jgi:hypothetical protein
VKWMRIIQLVLRCLELLCAVGLLVLMILIRGLDVSTGWIMRIVVRYSRHIMAAKVQILTLISPELLYFTQSTEYIIWEGKLQEDRQHHRRHTCYLLHSSTSLSHHSMPSALW